MDAVSVPTPGKLQITTHRQYDAVDSLTPSTVAPSPLDQFRAWFTEAQPHVLEPEAMSLSTATPTGVPSARFVLLKQVDATGFVFYTNYTSRKSAELVANTHAALAFYWREMHRQVRVVGRVQRVAPEESAAYYRSRPVGSRVGAWASRQSQVVGEGEVQARVQKLEERFGVGDGSGTERDVDIPLPDFWGGWRVIPDEVEFWSGKPSRLHDRVRYTRVNDPQSENQWQIVRLAP